MIQHLPGTQSTQREQHEAPYMAELREVKRLLKRWEGVIERIEATDQWQRFRFCANTAKEAGHMFSEQFLSYILDDMTGASSHPIDVDGDLPSLVFAHPNSLIVPSAQYIMCVMPMS